ncbi:MAG: hypothetical protein NZ570_00815 [Candidatus Caldarchaeum sp.]|nr:hypothetical protein [Candidatus Caldarchaeum sp.]MDW8359455.1 hypothetical protein [Candidatus Caldarchaeum sp.]
MKGLAPVMLGVLVAAALFTGIYFSEPMAPSEEAAAFATPEIRLADKAQPVETQVYLGVGAGSLATASIAYLAAWLLSRREPS